MECHRISIEPFGFETLLDDIPTSDFILLKMDLQVQVKFGTTDEAHRAIARLWMAAGARERLQAQVKELVAGYLRNAAADLKLEDLNTKRDDLQDKVLEAMASDLATMGVELASLTIQKITDASSGASAFEQLGRPSRAALKRDAEIAEAEALQVATEKRAIAETAAAQAKATSDMQIAEAEHELTVKREQLRGAQLEEKAKADQAGELAKAQAQLEVAHAAARVATETKQAEVVVPAEAAKQAAFLDAEAQKQRTIAEAEADAERIRVLALAELERDRAHAQGQRELAETYNLFSANAVQLLLFPKLFEMLPVLAEKIAQQYGNIDKLIVFDGGQNKLGQSAMQAFAQALEMANAMGLHVDLRNLMQGLQANDQNGHDESAHKAFVSAITGTPEE